MVRLDIFCLDRSSTGVFGEYSRSLGDGFSPRFEDCRQCDPCVGGDAEFVGDVESCDSVDGRDWQRYGFATRGGPTEVFDHQRLSAIRPRTLCCIGSDRRSAFLNQPCELRCCVRTHSQVSCLSSNERIDRRDRELDTHTHNRDG
jgi:hypothetical protein